MVKERKVLSLRCTGDFASFTVSIRVMKADYIRVVKYVGRIFVKSASMWVAMYVGVKVVDNYE